MASAGEMQHSAGNDEARRAEEGLARPRMPTRVYYLDPGLRTNVGHYANYCRYIVGELRGRGVEVLVFAHRDILLSLQKELGAVAHFQIHTHTPFVTWDGWRGWLADFATYCRHFPSVPQRSSGAYRARSGWRAWRGWLTRHAPRPPRASGSAVRRPRHPHGCSTRASLGAAPMAPIAPKKPPAGVRRGADQDRIAPGANDGRHSRGHAGSPA